ncbi:MAG: DUF308 domain-containing protein [Clostridia bacterium]|nr:DUF308 domain-containing protein [Clostridia bacterium]
MLGLKKIDLNSIRHSNGAYIALNIFIAVCGLMFVLFRQMSVATLSKAVGLALGIAGVIEIIVFFVRDLQNKAKWWDFPFGMSFILSGIAFLLFAKTPVSVIPLIPGCVGVANAVFACKKSRSLMKNGKKTALVFLIVNILAAALAAVVIVRPFVYGEIFSVLSGVSIMLSGITKAVLRFVERNIKNT